MPPFSGDLCLHCSSGLKLCLSSRCTFRAPSNNDGYCLVCKPPLAPRFCATFSCTKVLPPGGDTLCTLCITDCFPCSTVACDGRTCPGLAGFCKVCSGRTDGASRGTPSLRSRVPCRFAYLGCHEQVRSHQSAAPKSCRQCTSRGRPCAAFQHCHRRIPANSSADQCASCLRRGPFCVGPECSGCRNLKRGKPRRANYDNAGRCAYCRRSTCTVLGCHRKAVRSRSARLCSLHVSDAPAAPRSAVIAASSRAFRKHFRRRCALPWCTALFRNYSCHVRLCHPSQMVRPRGYEVGSWYPHRLPRSCFLCRRVYVGPRSVCPIVYERHPRSYMHFLRSAIFPG